MKAIFITYNQAYNEEIVEILDKNNQRGFTEWTETKGRGSKDGEPHFGNHAWPSLNNTILTIVPDDCVKSILADLREIDEAHRDLGLRAFSWNIEETV